MQEGMSRARAFGTRRRRVLVCVAATVAILGGLLASSPRAHAATAFGSQTNEYYLPTSDPAVDIYIQVVHPTNGGNLFAAPTILTYTPYADLGRNSDAAHWTALGYNRATADAIGTGNSGGCWDYGGPSERAIAKQVIEWIANTTLNGAWSDGKVGMLGGSYDGTTQYMAATAHPNGLMTIVPEAAIDRWYDYAYAGGIRYTDTNEPLGYEGPGAAGDEGVDTPFGFDFGLALPPPVDTNDPNWATNVVSKIRPCYQLAHTTEGYSTTPDYDQFWLDRDYLKDMGSIAIPVLVASNWGDWNVKQVDAWQAYHALTHSSFVRLFMGSRWHGHGVPPAGDMPAGSTFSATVDKWFDRFLKGNPNGIESTLPPVTTQNSNSSGAASDHYLIGPEHEPPPVKLYLSHAGDGSWTLVPNPGVPAGSPVASFNWTDTNTESHSAAQPFIAGAGYIGFQTPVLSRDVRLFGEPVLHLWSTVQRNWVTITPSLLDFDPSRYSGGNATDNHAVIGLTRGWLDSRYRNGLDHRDNVTAGQPFVEDITLWPSDYTIKAGHRLVLLVSTEIADWAIPKVYDNPLQPVPTVQLDYEQGQSYLQLPLVGLESADQLFIAPASFVPDIPFMPLLPAAALAIALPVLWRRRRRGMRPVAR